MTTLIIPIYNGEAAIPAMWRAVRDWKRARAEETALVFVNDGSTDNTGAMLDVLVQEDPTLRIFHLRENMGKGMALATAVAQLTSDSVVVFTDVDLPYTLEAVDAAVAYLQKHTRADLVIGSRALRKTEQYSRYRKVFSSVFRLLLPRAVRAYSDTQCGLKAFRMPVAKDLFVHLKTSRWVFDVELLLRASRAKYVVHEQAVTLRSGLARGKGGLTLMGDGLKVIRDMITIYWANHKGHYDETLQS